MIVQFKYIYEEDSTETIHRDILVTPNANTQSPT